jgi:hypothetical protein
MAFRVYLNLRLSFVIIMMAMCFVSSPGLAKKPHHVHAPVPLLKAGQPVKWWFVFKFNAKTFPACDEGERSCPFGGNVELQKYKQFGQQYVYASSRKPALQKGAGCLGDTMVDPVGATFDEIYNGNYYYVIWNDQPYGDPRIPGCGKNCDAPWGHSKGMLAWDEKGSGMVMQVTTPDWPEAGNKLHPRLTDGNTLGCVHEDNNIMVSQHFFALKLNKQDVIKVLRGLQNASVATDPANPQVVHNGGPLDIQELVGSLGKKNKNTEYIKERLSSGTTMISKPSALHVPSWQMVSAILGGVPLRTATWWQGPKIYSTAGSADIACWDDQLGTAGAVDIALTGHWGDREFGLQGGPGANFNHAKIGVSLDPQHHYAIFGDLNQQGAISGKCDRSQNGRGGLFYVLDNAALAADIGKLIDGDTAPVQEPMRLNDDHNQ